MERCNSGSSRHLADGQMLSGCAMDAQIQSGKTMGKAGEKLGKPGKMMGKTQKMMIYPLVNIQKTMERSTMFNG